MGGAKGEVNKKTLISLLNHHFIIVKCYIVLDIVLTVIFRHYCWVNVFNKNVCACVFYPVASYL